MSNYNTQLQSNNTDLQAILETINELPEAGGSGEQATPVISVNSSNGLITATAGTKSSTYQLAFQSAKTITPSTVSQIAVSSGYYTGGNITVAGDSNLIAGNIKSGISIFGVSGTLEGGASSGEQVEWSANEDAMVTGTLSNYFNDRVKSIDKYAFYSRSKLISINFPICTNIGTSAFCRCYSLTTANFPQVTTIDNYAFYYCSNLTTISFPQAITIGNSAFEDCRSLTIADFPQAITIGNSAFEGCSSLTIANFPQAITIGDSAFYRCTSLTTNSFPQATAIGSYAFYWCENLTAVNFPVATTIGSQAFYNCDRLTTVSFPQVTTIDSSAFYWCTSLTTVSFPMATIISGSSAFWCCFYLKSLYLTGPNLCTLSNSNAFASTPIGGFSIYAGTYGSIYVPASLLTSYQTATNWTYYSSRFVGVTTMITFTIEGTDILGDPLYYEFQAEQGMTWAQWCDSDYNTIKANVGGLGEIGFGGGIEYYAIYDLVGGEPDVDYMVLSSDEIVNGRAYRAEYSP